VNKRYIKTLMRRKPWYVSLWHKVYFTYYFYLGYKLRIWKERCILYFGEPDLYYINETGELLYVTSANYEKTISVDLGESALIKHENYNTGEIRLLSAIYFGNRKKATREQSYTEILRPYNQ
jgi:hypothetical protein